MAPPQPRTRPPGRIFSHSPSIREVRPRWLRTPGSSEVIFTAGAQAAAGGGAAGGPPSVLLQAIAAVQAQGSGAPSECEATPDRQPVTQPDGTGRRQALSAMRPRGSQGSLQYSTGGPAPGPSAEHARSGSPPEAGASAAAASQEPRHPSLAPGAGAGTDDGRVAAGHKHRSPPAAPGHHSGRTWASFGSVVHRGGSHHDGGPVAESTSGHGSPKRGRDTGSLRTGRSSPTVRFQRSSPRGTMHTILQQEARPA